MVMISWRCSCDMGKTRNAYMILVRKFLWSGQQGGWKITFWQILGRRAMRMGCGWNWLKVKFVNYKKGDLYISVMETLCSFTREFFGGRKLLWPIFMYYPCCCQEALKEITYIRDMIVSLQMKISAYPETPHVWTRICSYLTIVLVWCWVTWYFALLVCSVTWNLSVQNPSMPMLWCWCEKLALYLWPVLKPVCCGPKFCNTMYFLQVPTCQKMMWLLLLIGLGCMWWMIRSRFSWSYRSLK